MGWRTSPAMIVAKQETGKHKEEVKVSAFEDIYRGINHNWAILLPGNLGSAALGRWPPTCGERQTLQNTQTRQSA